MCSRRDGGDPVAAYHRGMLDLVIFLANLAATWFMCGLIWFVQVVHYPAFCDVGGAGFAAYHARHTRQTTLIVLGPMIVEGITAVMLAARPTPWLPPAGAWSGLVLVAVIWASTFTLQVPMHRLLGGGFDEAPHRRLCRTNWIRTSAWSARAILLLICLGLTLR